MFGSVLGTRELSRAQATRSTSAHPTPFISIKYRNCRFMRSLVVVSRKFTAVYAVFVLTVERLAAEKSIMSADRALRTEDEPERNSRRQVQES